MKSILDEVLSESTVLNERPYSRTQGAIDKATGKVKGVFGSGQVEQGAAAAGKHANDLWKQFKNYLGQVYGTAPDMVDYNEVENFFEANGLDPKVLGPNTNRKFSPKDVGECLLKAVREYAKYPASQRQQGQNAGTGQPPAATPPAGSPGTPPANPPAGTPPASGNPAGTPPAANPPAGTPPSGPNLKTALQNLTQDQRDALLKLIS